MTAVVIRAWDVRHNPVGYAVAEFATAPDEENGVFILPEEHPLVEVAKRDPWLISFFTVLSTEQLQWRLVSVLLDETDTKRVFTSRPWINELRRELRSDQWFMENVVETGAGL